MTVAAILLAAGASTRMRGADKLLREIDGEPLLRRSARALVASRAAPVLVVLGHASDARRAVVDDLPLSIVMAQDWQEGMAASVRAGLAVLPPVEAAMIALADMPLLTASHFDALIEAFDPQHAPIVRAADARGQPGHPVIFANHHFAELKMQSGDEGGRAVVRRHHGSVKTVGLPGVAASLDLDTPEAWSEWVGR